MGGSVPKRGREPKEGSVQTTRKRKECRVHYTVLFDTSSHWLTQQSIWTSSCGRTAPRSTYEQTQTFVQFTVVFLSRKTTDLKHINSRCSGKPQ